MDPLEAVQMGTINTARAYRIDHRVGAIAPGYEADMVLVDDLRDFRTSRVWLNGSEIKRPYRLPRFDYPAKALNSVKLEQLRPEDIALECGGKEAKVRVLTAEDLSLATTIDIMDAKVEDGRVIPDVTRDILKGVVLERFGRGKGHNTGLIRGYGLQEGAIAGSIGQDSQNIVAVGTNDEDICAAVNAVAEMQGGVVLTSGGKKTAAIELPIFGIMTEKSFEDLEKDLRTSTDSTKKWAGPLRIRCLPSAFFLPLWSYLTEAFPTEGL